MRDSSKDVSSDGTMLDVMSVPPYRVIFVFRPDSVPQAANVTSSGPDASVQVFAALNDEDKIYPCCAEDSQANRIGAQVDFSSNGVLVVTVTDVIPCGYQVSVVLEFGALYHDPIWDGTFFPMRFNVGATPQERAPGEPCRLDPSQP